MIYKQIFDQIYDAVASRMEANTDSIAWHDRWNMEHEIVDSYKNTEYAEFAVDIRECIINALS